MSKQAPIERDRLIVALRRQGEGMREIAEMHGLSRERVRQILTRQGDPTLLGQQVFPKKRPPRFCPICGAPVQDRKARHCSLICGGLARSRLPRDWQAQALAMRVEGVSWQKIGDWLGIKYTNLPFRLRRWSRQTGVDVSAAFGRRAHLLAHPSPQPLDNPSGSVGEGHETALAGAASAGASA